MKEIIKIILFIVVVVFVLMGNQFLVSKVLQDEYLQVICGASSQLALVIFLYWIFNKFFVGIEFSHTDFMADFKNLRWIYRGLFFGAALIISTFLISYLTKSISIHISIKPNDFLIYLGILILTTLSTAIWEEVVFRGVVLQGFTKVIGTHWGSVLVALIFALMHLFSPVRSWQMILSTFFAGLLLNYAFVNSKNIWFAISVHFSWNFFNSLLYSKKYMGIEYVNPILAGYKNPEEGIIAITITFIGFLVSFFWLPRSQKGDP